MKIKNVEERWHEKKDDTANAFLQYFRIVYSKSYPIDIRQIFQIVEVKVDEAMNSTLLQEFKLEEIKRALNQMHPNKASGPDGMTIGFYKKILECGRTSYYKSYSGLTQ